jgi:hypothetical protein
VGKIFKTMKDAEPRSMSDGLTANMDWSWRGKWVDETKKKLGPIPAKNSQPGSTSKR